MIYLRTIIVYKNNRMTNDVVIENLRKQTLKI